MYNKTTDGNKYERHEQGQPLNYKLLSLDRHSNKHVCERLTLPNLEHWVNSKTWEKNSKGYSSGWSRSEDRYASTDTYIYLSLRLITTYKIFII